MNLADAITAVERGQQDYNAAATQTQNDQATVSAIQAKLDAANAQVANDQQAQNDAAAQFNSALDQLITAATAAKIPAPAVPPAPTA